MAARRKQGQVVRDAQRTSDSELQMSWAAFGVGPGGPGADSSAAGAPGAGGGDHAGGGGSDPSAQGGGGSDAEAWGGDHESEVPSGPAAAEQSDAQHAEGEAQYGGPDSEGPGVIQRFKNFLQDRLSPDKDDLGIIGLTPFGKPLVAGEMIMNDLAELTGLPLGPVPDHAPPEGQEWGGSEVYGHPGGGTAEGEDEGTVETDTPPLDYLQYTENLTPPWQTGQMQMGSSARMAPMPDWLRNTQMPLQRAEMGELKLGSY